MATKYTTDGVRKAAAAGRFWTCRLEYRGFSGTNQTGTSEKYWLCHGKGYDKITVVWGRLTSQGDVKRGQMSKPYSYFTNMVDKKLAKGYGFAKGSRDDLKPLHKSAKKPATPKAPASGQAQQPLPWAGSPLPSTPAAPPTALPSTPAAPSLPGPWGQVVALKPTRTGFKALDKDGGVLMTMDSEAARKMSQSHAVPVLGLGF